MKKIALVVVLAAFFQTSAHAFLFSKNKREDLCAEINANDLGVYLIFHSDTTYSELEPMLGKKVCVKPRQKEYLIDTYTRLEDKIQQRLDAFVGPQDYSKNGFSE